ncbi:MAG: hypothetical protein KGJ86_19160, partial [Chloroflexota bacterium]|nr:hypothetical protein [Chloroflexota bacterium]
MDLGLWVPNTHETLADPEVFLSIAQLADELGVASLCVNDHILVAAEDELQNQGDRQTQDVRRARQTVFDPLMVLSF